MKRTPQKITLNSSAARRARSSATKPALALLFGLLLVGGVRAQEEKAVELQPAAPPVAVVATAGSVRFTAPARTQHLRLKVFTTDHEQLYDSQEVAGGTLDWDYRNQQGQRLPDGEYRYALTLKGAKGEPQAQRGTVKLRGGEATVSWEAGPMPLGNQVVDGDIVFTSPGQFTYPRDIRLSDNFGGLRFYGADSLTTTPAGAAIQFFGNNAAPFNGQLYLDSGAFDSAALVFRTAGTGGTITERMRVTANGDVGIGTSNPTNKLHVVSTGSAVRGENTGNGFGVTGQTVNGTGVIGFNTGTGGIGVSGFTGNNGISVRGNGTSWFEGDSTPLSASLTSGTGVAIGSNISGGFGYVFAFNYQTFTPQVLALNSPGGSVGIGTLSPTQTLDVSGRARVRSIPLLASTATVCFNAAGDLLQCGASSLRLKTDVRPFAAGLEVVRRLRPISFRWKESGLADVGLGAEEVATIAPSLVFTNSKGEIEGVKYERLNVLLINAVTEQQAQIEQQQKQLQRQQAVIEGLRQLVCGQHPQANVCQ